MVNLSKSEYRVKRLMIMWAGLFACLLAASGANGQEVGVAARVNGVDITVFRLERFFEEFSKGQGGGHQLITNPTAYKNMKRRALDQLIDREILRQEAERRKIQVSDEELKAVIREIEGKFKDRQGYLHKLGTMGFTEESYAAYVREDLAIDRLMQRGVEAPPVTDAEMEKFYEGNPDKFMRPDVVRARHILIQVAPDAEAEKREAARGRAAELLAKIRGGADFAALARDNSEDSSAQAGGDLGWFPRMQMVKPFEDAAFALEPGQISDLVETEFGFHIIKLEAKQAGEKVALAEVKDQVRQYLEGAKRQEASQKLLERLRSEAKISNT